MLAFMSFPLIYALLAYPPQESPRFRVSYSFEKLPLVGDTLLLSVRVVALEPPDSCLVKISFSEGIDCLSGEPLYRGPITTDLTMTFHVVVTDTGRHNIWTKTQAFDEKIGYRNYDIHNLYIRSSSDTAEYYTSPPDGYFGVVQPPEMDTIPDTTGSKDKFVISGKVTFYDKDEDKRTPLPYALVEIRVYWLLGWYTAGADYADENGFYSCTAATNELAVSYNSTLTVKPHFRGA